MKEKRYTMNTKRDLRIILRVIVIIFVILALIMLWGKESIERVFRPYTKLSDNEWIKLDFGVYNAKPGSYLGKYSGAEWGNVHSLEGFSSKDLLYVEFYYPIGDTREYIFLNKELEEPIKWLTIKQIIITESDGSTIKIADSSVLNRIKEVLRDETGSEYSPDVLNTVVYFDVECNLSWKCAIEKRDNGFIYLIGYDMENMVWLEYDVTNLLSGIY